MCRVRCHAGGRRAVAPTEAELVVVRATPRQTRGRRDLLRLVGAEDGRVHYRVAYGDPQRRFVLARSRGGWALRLRRRLRDDERLLQQLELEARAVRPTGTGTRARGGRRVREAPAPLRLYVAVRIEPEPEPARD